MTFAIHRRQWLLAFLSTCAFTIGLGAVVAVPAYGAAQTEVPAAATAGEAVRTGAGLERSRRWIEAVEFYEKSIKSWPEDGQLKYALRRTKVQFSIERRYSDKSFLEDMLPMGSLEVSGHLDDVLGKVRTHYVDSVTSTSFVAHGTESLYHALTNDKFLQRNLPQGNPDQISRLRRTLRDDYWNRTCPTPEATRRVVFEISEVAARETGLSQTASILEFVFGGCNSLDDYSNYLTPGRLEDLYGNIEGEFVGIGIEMKAEQGQGLYLVNVLPESPAEEGGALAGDYIVSIDGKNCRNMTTEEAAALLQGAPQSRVRLELYDGSTARPATLTRRAVKVKSIPVVKMLDETSGVGYIKMTGFQKNSAEELDAALASLRRQGMQALVWDLRGNPGGLLTAAVEVLDRFLDEGVLVSTKGRVQDQNWTYSATINNPRESQFVRVPLVVLVDGDSASASEIVAGAVRDHHRGTLVGRKTYGKWSVQSILPGRSQTGLRLTTAKFYSPGGHTYGKIGVEPDVVVTIEKGEYATGYLSRKPALTDDKDVSAGMEVLKKQLARR